MVLTKLSSLIDQFAVNVPELNQENKIFVSLLKDTIPKKINQLAIALNTNNKVAKNTTCFSPNTLWRKPQTKAPKRGDSITNSNKN